MTELPLQTHSRWKPRISLLTMLLLMTIVGLAIALWLRAHELAPLRAQLRQLIAETGRLVIEDETKVHAVQVRTGDTRSWRWRVWVPEGQRMALHLRWGGVPKSGVPAPMDTTYLNAGEHWISLEAKRDGSNGRWKSSLQTPGGGIGSYIPDDAHWFDGGLSVVRAEGVARSTTVFDDNEPVIVLARRRAARTVAELDDNDVMAPGIIVWLERQ